MRTFSRILTFIGGSVRRLVVLAALIFFFGGQFLGLWDSPSLINVNLEPPPAIAQKAAAVLSPPAGKADIGSEVWTPAGQGGGLANAEAHFRKHGDEFPFDSSYSYINAALDFVTNPPPGTLSVVQKDGDRVYYNEAKNYFAVTRGDGKIRTFFRPDPEIHGHKSNMDYFRAQEKR